MVILSMLVGVWFVFFVLGLTTFAWKADLLLIYGWFGVFLVIFLLMSIRKKTMTDEKRRKIEQREFERKERRRPVDAVLISTYLERKSSLGWALLGYWAEGPCGARHGARLGKVIKKAVFSVRYADGHTGTEDVDMESYRFKELSALLLE